MSVTKLDVILLNKKFPALAAVDIALLLDVDGGWVRATARRNQLTLGNANDKAERDAMVQRSQNFTNAYSFVNDLPHYEAEIGELKAEIESEKKPNDQTVADDG